MPSRAHARTHTRMHACIHSRTHHTSTHSHTRALHTSTHSHTRAHTQTPDINTFSHTCTHSDSTHQHVHTSAHTLPHRRPGVNTRRITSQVSHHLCYFAPYILVHKNALTSVICGGRPLRVLNPLQSHDLRLFFIIIIYMYNPYGTHILPTLQIVLHIQPSAIQLTIWVGRDEIAVVCILKFVWEAKMSVDGLEKKTEDRQLQVRTEVQC